MAPPSVHSPYSFSPRLFHSLPSLPSFNSRVDFSVFNTFSIFNDILCTLQYCQQPMPLLKLPHSNLVVSAPTSLPDVLHTHTYALLGPQRDPFPKAKSVSSPSNQFKYPSFTLGPAQYITFASYGFPFALWWSLVTHHSYMQSQTIHSRFGGHPLPTIHTCSKCSLLPPTSQACQYIPYTMHH